MNDETEDQNKILIEKGTVYPTTTEFVSKHKTSYNNQEDFEVQVLEGESNFAIYCDIVGIYKLENIPLKPLGQVHFICKLSISANGVVTPELKLDSDYHTQEEIDAARVIVESR